MTENEVLSWFERYEPRDEPLMCAYEYLRDYHRNAQKNNDQLSWDDLQRFFGRPVYYIVDKNRGWMILRELRITDSGHWVISDNDFEVRFENGRFYRMEI